MIIFFCFKLLIYSNNINSIDSLKPQQYLLKSKPKTKTRKEMLCCVGQKKERKIVNGKFRKPYYNFVSVASGKFLDVGQNSDKQDVIVVSQRNGGETQKFEIEQKGPDYFIRTKKGKQYLTVEGPQNGTKVYLTPKSMDQSQRFRIQQLKGGSKYVIYTFFGKVIDAINGQAQNGSIIQDDFIGQAHQLWTLICDEKTK